MAELTEVSYAEHGNLKVKADSAINFAKSSHIMQLRVTEVVQANANFPVFVIKNSHTGDWMLTALTSLMSGTNLFVKEGKWDATYEPICMQTHPLYLMKSAKDDKSYTVGLMNDPKDFSEESGTALFDSENKGSIYMSRVSSLLEASIKQDIQTFEFLATLSSKGLLKTMDLVVQYPENQAETITGLHTIDEDKLRELDAEQLKAFHDNGYLSVMYSMLNSIYQLNSIIKRNNADTSNKQIAKVNLTAKSSDIS